MYGKRMLVLAAALLLAEQGMCQADPHPLMGPGAPAPLATSRPQGATNVPTLAPPQSPSILTAVFRAGEEAAGAGAVRWNAGVIDEGRQSHVEHTFTLKNTTSRPITVSRVRGSCGCETLFLTKAGKEAPTATAAPGEAVQVRVSVALRAGQTGEMHKYAWAFGPDATSPPLGSMEIAMTVRPPVVFEPATLDFGALSVGVPKSVSMTVTADADALAGKPLPTPVATAKSVTITPDGPETAAQRDGKAARSRRFRVTMSAPAEAGPVSGSVSLPAPSSSPLTMASAPVTGTVSGTLTAQPGSVFFGSVPAGQGVSREVLLSEAASQRGKALSVSSGSPWLTARVQEAAGTKPLLVVMLKPDAPDGVVQTQVVVTSASGERLSIPVVAEVLKHGP